MNKAKWNPYCLTNPYREREREGGDRGERIFSHFTIIQKHRFNLEISNFFLVISLKKYNYKKHEKLFLLNFLMLHNFYCIQFHYIIFFSHAKISAFVIFLNMSIFIFFIFLNLISFLIF